MQLRYRNIYIERKVNIEDTPAESPTKKAAGKIEHNYGSQSVNAIINPPHQANSLSRTLITTRVILQIQLMILLRIPPLARGQDLRRDGPAAPPLLLHLLRHLLGRLLLLLVVVEDGAAVLRPAVGALSVLGCRVVHLVEEFEQLAVSDLVWVEGYLEGFGVCNGTITALE